MHCRCMKKQNFFLPWRVKKQKNKTNSFLCFLGESTARQSVYGFIWPLPTLPCKHSLWTTPKYDLFTNWYFECVSYSKLTKPKSVVCCEKRSYSKKLWVGNLCCSLCKENYFWPRARGPRNKKIVIYLKILLDKMKA